MGQLTIEVTYSIDQGQKGDWYTEPIPPSIQIQDVKIVEQPEGKELESFLYHMEQEIQEYEEGI